MSEFAPIADAFPGPSENSYKEGGDWYTNLKPVLKNARESLGKSKKTKKDHQVGIASLEANKDVYEKGKDEA